MKHIAISFLLLLAAGLSGCNVPGAGIQTGTPVSTPTQMATLPPLPTPTVIPSATPPAQLNADSLNNSTYQVPQYKKSVTLVDGKYSGGSGADALSVNLLPQVAIGDLNKDGLDDAAVLIAENSGGSGVFVSLVVVFNQNGTPQQGGAVLIDDRPKIQSISIQDGKILLDAVIHGPGDAMVNPTLAVKETFETSGSRIELARFDSTNAGGAARSIQIDSPQEGSEASGSVQLKGSMPIAPFENNLGYRIIDAQGNQLLQASFLVKADQPGEPATFDQAIDLSTLAGAGLVRLELVEVSMADGSILTMNSVRLQVK